MDTTQRKLKTIHVSIAFLFNADGEVLIARRPEDKLFGGLWEFPGGKLERDETASDALTRELDEELSIGTEAVGLLRCFEFVVSNHMRLCFHPIVVEHISGKICLIEHSQAAWAPPTSLECYSLTAPAYEAASILMEYVRDKLCKPDAQPVVI